MWHVVGNSGGPGPIFLWVRTHFTYTSTQFSN